MQRGLAARGQEELLEAGPSAPRTPPRPQQNPLSVFQARLGWSSIRPSVSSIRKQPLEAAGKEDKGAGVWILAKVGLQGLRSGLLLLTHC